MSTSCCPMYSTGSLKGDSGQRDAHAVNSPMRFAPTFHSPMCGPLTGTCAIVFMFRSSLEIGMARRAPNPQHAPTEAETIAAAYLYASKGDARSALLHAIEDALADLSEAERRTMNRDRLISRGFIRAGSVTAADRV